MSENDHIFNAALRRAVEHESNKIARLDGSLLRHADSERDALADLARHEYQCVKPCGKSDVDLRHKGILERLLGHRTEHARCADDGDPTLNAEHGVERFLRCWTRCAGHFRSTGSRLSPASAHFSLPLRGSHCRGTARVC